MRLHGVHTTKTAGWCAVEKNQEQAKRLPSDWRDEYPLDLRWALAEFD
jgi:hypothetical protein